MAALAPPSSLDAEMALLGAALYDNAVAAQTLGLESRHFFEPLHGRLWAALTRMTAEGRPADPVTVGVAMAGDPAFAEFGGVRYLADLVDTAPVSTVAPEYARTILELAMRRDLIRLGGEVSAAANRHDKPAFELMAETRAKLDLLEAGSAPADETTAAGLAADGAFEAMKDVSLNGRLRGALTGLRCIDRRMGGLQPGALVVIGGRPGMGKTALARAVAHGCAVKNPAALVLFLGLEMGPTELMQRELSALTHQYGQGVEYQAMAMGALAPPDLEQVSRARAHVPANLILGDTPRLDVGAVRRMAWTAKRKGLVAVIIDYLQLMTRPPALGRNEASVLGQMTAELKQIARQLDVCVVLLSQLSRRVEEREDKRPQLADLRESGAIEQDADAVLFPFRPVYYLERAEPPVSAPDKRRAWEDQCDAERLRLEVICAKLRQGKTGRDMQEYRAEYDHISDAWEEGG